MIKKIALSLIIFISYQSTASSLDCEKIYITGIGEVDKQSIRYMREFENACIFIEKLIPGTAGKSSYRKEICNLDQKNMNSEYTYIEFLQAEFTGDNLYFQFEITPLGLAPPETKWCKTIFINEMPNHFTCDDRSPSYG